MTEPFDFLFAGIARNLRFSTIADKAKLCLWIVDNKLVEVPDSVTGMAKMPYKFF
jgi:hypothetical protein